MRLAFFDLDGTLLHGDSVTLYLDFLLAKGLITPEYRKLDDGLLEEFFQGRLDVMKYYTFALEPLAGKTRAELASLLHEYVTQWIKPKIYPQAQELIASHQQQGDLVAIVSATCDLMVTPIAKEIFQIEHVIASQVIYQNDMLTAQVDPNISHQAGKAKRIKEFCALHHLDLSDSISYGDSINDLQMLETTSKACVVNPHHKLLQIAQQRHWQILHF